MSGPLILLGTDLGAHTPDGVAPLIVGPVAVLPTASAYEHPHRLADAVLGWLAVHGLHGDEVPVLTRRDACEVANADRMAGAGTIVITSGTAMHARSVLKETPLWDRLVAAHRGGTVVVAAGAGATVLTDPMADSRGGGLTLGLGLVTKLAVLAGSSGWPVPQVKRMRRLASGDVVVATIADDAVLVGEGAGWRAIGHVEVHASDRAVGVDRLPAVD